MDEVFALTVKTRIVSFVVSVSRVCVKKTEVRVHAVRFSKGSQSVHDTVWEGNCQAGSIHFLSYLFSVD